ncbi:MAG TPA: hypothetical protein VFB22_15010 [Candidatus Baltobacteraceae bacterium]|nr:hypothetical protein [Candidatus Baltobacteraceae bacterium]
MRRMRALAALAVLALLPLPALAQQAPATGSARVSYKVLPYVKASVTPNYQSGFGPIGGLGSGSTPAVGSGAVLDGGTVDFGNVVVGYQYLYKYAAQVNVQTNDTSGFIVYAEGATDLNGSNPTPSPATYPLFQTLYWLVSNAANTAFSPATSFNSTTSGTPLGVNGANGISYPGSPPGSASVWSTTTAGTLAEGYDYQLRLSSAMPTSQFNVYIVYTVVGN